MQESLKIKLKIILEKYFDFSKPELSWEDFKADWTKTVEEFQANLSENENTFLHQVYTELENILIHIPSKNMLSKELDWKKWITEDDFLNFAICKESLASKVAPEQFGILLKNAVKSGYFKRPYLDNDNFYLQVRKYMKIDR